MTVNCIAIDDEPLALSKIEGFVSKIDFLNMIRTFSDPLEAIPFLKEHDVDLVFLDIHMDQLSGIELLENISIEARVILTTAHSQYALKGYDLQVQDYLLKPFSFERFLKACNNAYDQLMLKKNKIAATGPEHLFVKSGMVHRKIRIDDIYLIEGMKDYISIWTKDERVMTLMSFAQILKLLPANNFLRIHRSYIIAINKLREIGKGSVRISDRTLPIGDTYKEAVRSRLGV